jgi:hypothetical protein
MIAAGRPLPVPDEIRHEKMLSFEQGGPTLDQKIAHAKRNLAAIELVERINALPARRETITALDCFPSSQCPR